MVLVRLSGLILIVAFAVASMGYSPFTVAVTGMASATMVVE